ncbi:MAG: hypothetical protein ACREKE_05570 [bacterium]
MPMEHAQVEPLLKDYFAGSLDRAATRELHVHFKTCEICRSRMRLRLAGAESDRERRRSDRGSAPPEIQARIAGNRNLLIQILLLMIFAWFVWKMKR